MHSTQIPNPDQMNKLLEILQQLEKEEELLQQKRRGKQAQALAPWEAAAAKGMKKAFEMVEGE